MQFWELFFKVLPRKPMRALAAAYWHCTRRRVRARNRLRAASIDLPFAYAVWIDRVEGDRIRTDESEAAALKSANPVRYSIVLHSEGPYDRAQMHRSMQSLDRQVYSSWAVAGLPKDPLDSVVETADGDYVIPLRVGDALSKTALLRLTEAHEANPGVSILYGDQDEFDEHGRRSRPWFKPCWNRELFLAQDYLSQAIAVETRLARKIARTTNNLSEFVLAAAFEADPCIVRVPHILSHVATPLEDQSRRVAALARLLRPDGAECSPGPFGTIKVEWPLPAKLPLVSIVIPTRDKLGLLRVCVDSVLSQTEYPEFEILIIDNGSVERSTAAYFAAISKNPKVRILDYPGMYNFSAINNYAVQRARGSHLCLLNNDTEVVEPSWLTELMRYAVKKDVGAVGAKLLYEDGTIQHAGVVVGLGEAAGHAHRHLPGNDPGYFRLPHVAQYISAVTAACLVVEKRKFLAIGGLDEADLPVAFNDVDFCLKLEQAGWRNVYVPHAVLVHHESRSRGSDTSSVNIDRYHRELKVLQDRWGTKTYDDPLHNPNLDRYSETFVIDI